MSNGEILRYWREARDQTAVIQILADLNCTDKAHIRAVLCAAGAMPEGACRDKRKRPLSPQREDAIRELLLKGASITEVMRQTKSGHDTVKSIVKTLGEAYQPVFRRNTKPAAR